jgi:hypothetical protein
MDLSQLSRPSRLLAKIVVVRVCAEPDVEAAEAAAAEAPPRRRLRSRAPRAAHRVAARAHPPEHAVHLARRLVRAATGLL